MRENLHNFIRFWFDKSIMWTIYPSPLKKNYISMWMVYNIQRGAKNFLKLIPDTKANQWLAAE